MTQLCAARGGGGAPLIGGRCHCTHGAEGGVSAAADFAANKRLTLKDMRGEFVRGWDDSRAVDTSRVLGSDQAGQLAAHTHTYASARTDIGSGGQTVTGGTGSGQTTGTTGGTENSSENRPRNIAWLWCVWF